ncbi:MAG: hypothetical protein A2X86_09735 [Bdellovibrionales bacterium GWA2_49_15]|nr:MAG: hypothetical protein A2X86_09735 [Bdellovibrionales bacterium GWA2_49_15]HAZ13062.1 hypothetical protein [Bdellovibrionales bacterium]
MLPTICFPIGFSAGGGPAVFSNYTSGIKDEQSGHAAIRTYGGAGIDLEATAEAFWRLRVVGGFGYLGESAKVQYKYTDPANALETGQMDNLSAELLHLQFRLGLRWDFIRIGPIAIFFGGGGAIDAISFTYDEVEYRSANGQSDRGFKQGGDSADVTGTYGDFGIEARGKEMGFRIKAQYFDGMSSPVDTINGQRFDYKNKQISVIIFHLL